MPHELISFPQVQKMHRNCGPSDDGSCTPGCSIIADTWPQVTVHWGAAGHDRGGNVQVSLIEYEKPAWGDWNKRVNEALELQSPVRDVDVLTIERETHSMVLSRSELNDLIRVLRRARDQAYGKDE